MNVHRLLPLACLFLMLAAASPGEARSLGENARTYVSVTSWLRSLFHPVPRSVSSRIESDGRDESTAAQIVTWGRIKERYREGGNTGGKD